MLKEFELFKIVPCKILFMGSGNVLKIYCCLHMHYIRNMMFKIYFSFLNIIDEPIVNIYRIVRYHLHFL
jgi:hypothetical protein